MYKWEALNEKVERTQGAMEERAEELSALLGSLSEELLDAYLSSDFGALRKLVERVREEVEYVADAFIEEDDARLEALQEKAEMTEDEEWEEVNEE